MTPAEEFANDPENRNVLRSLLASPVLRKALEILEDELKPVFPDPAAMADPTLAAARNHALAGALHITRGLGRLSTAPPEKKPPVPPVRPLLSEKEYQERVKKNSTPAP